MKYKEYNEVTALFFKLSKQLAVSIMLILTTTLYGGETPDSPTEKSIAAPNKTEMKEKIIEPLKEQPPDDHIETQKQQTTDDSSNAKKEELDTFLLQHRVKTPARRPTLLALPQQQTGCHNSRDTAKYHPFPTETFTLLQSPYEDTYHQKLHGMLTTLSTKKLCENSREAQKVILQTAKEWSYANARTVIIKRDTMHYDSFNKLARNFFDFMTAQPDSNPLDSIFIIQFRNRNQPHYWIGYLNSEQNIREDCEIKQLSLSTSHSFDDKRPPLIHHYTCSVDALGDELYKQNQTEQLCIMKLSSSGSPIYLSEEDRDLFFMTLHNLRL